MSSPSSDATARKAEFDRLMTAANVHRRRGDYAEATNAVKQALQIDPGSIEAREFAADMIYAHGDVEKAAEHYKAILEIEPNRVSAEEKYARAIVEISEAERQKDLMKLMLENPGKYRRAQPKKSSTIAVLFSMAPGFGHIYCGQYTLGIGIFVGWVVACLLFLFTLNPAAESTQRISTVSALFACVAASLHIYALLSAAQQAEKMKSKADSKSSEPE